MIKFLIGTIIGFALCLYQVFRWGLLDNEKVLAVWRRILKNIQRPKANNDRNLSKTSRAINDGFEPERHGITGSANAGVKPLDN